MKLQDTVGFGLRHVLLAIAIAGALTTACTQEPPECQVGRSEFQAVYIPVGTLTCPQLHGEILGTHTYYKQGSDGYSDYDQPASVGIQSDPIGLALSEGVRDPNTAHLPYAVGEFSEARPDSGDICRVPSLSVAEQDTPEFTYTTEIDGVEVDVTVPATHRIYEWENMEVLVSPAYTGSQWQARLTYTENGCTATYDVRAVMSVNSCETTADCYGEGSFINPDFDVVCDPDLEACVLAAPVPSLK